jgi:hypothetical protein
MDAIHYKLSRDLSVPVCEITHEYVHISSSVAVPEMVLVSLGLRTGQDLTNYIVQYEISL